MLTLLLQSLLTDLLVPVLCNGHIRSHALNEHEEQITLIGKGNSDFTLWMEGALSPLRCYGNVTPGHVMELCNEYNNRKKFLFYTEKVLRSLHHLVSTKSRHKLSNLHKHQNLE